MLFTLYFIKSTETQTKDLKSHNGKSFRAVADSKKILFWNDFFGVTDYSFGLGEEPFSKFNCPVRSCFITSDKRWIPVDQFDAIVFHGPEYNPVIKSDFPSPRSKNQRYVYFSQESPANRKVDYNLNDFFNWTMTYRLDSDIPAYYFYLRDKTGKLIAPVVKPKWKQPNFENIIDFSTIYKRKKIAAAWFVSNCNSASGRENYIRELQKFLHVDVYGSCGPYECPKSQMQDCFDIIKNDYYFYLSFENSICRDYVTEKVVNALDNDAVPIVFGGANYDNFLPPHSYVDAGKLSPQQLALTVKNLIANEVEYLKYFWWKKYYWHNDDIPPFCKLCEMLHDNSIDSKSYRIHDWWHGNENNTMCKVSAYN